jgi:hypothetical protein
MAFTDRKFHSQANQITCTIVLLGMSLLLTEAVFAIDAGSVTSGQHTAASAGGAVRPVRWQFVKKERRDPFTFARKDGGNTEGSKRGKPGPPPPQLKAEQTAEQAYALGQAALQEGLVAEALEQSSQGLRALQAVPNGSGEQSLRERLRRLWKAAGRLKARQDAEAEFAGLTLQVSGIVAGERRALAVVNGELVHRGDVVATTSEGLHVVIDEIRADQVVFVYKAIRMTRRLSDGVAAR